MMGMFLRSASILLAAVDAEVCRHGTAMAPH
jgi:hypothetical protein